MQLRYVSIGFYCMSNKCRFHYVNRILHVFGPKHPFLFKVSNVAFGDFETEMLSETVVVKSDTVLFLRVCMTPCCSSKVPFRENAKARSMRLVTKTKKTKTHTQLFSLAQQFSHCILQHLKVVALATQRSTRPPDLPLPLVRSHAASM